MKRAGEPLENQDLKRTKLTEGEDPKSKYEHLRPFLSSAVDKALSKDFMDLSFLLGLVDHAFQFTFPMFKAILADPQMKEISNMLILVREGLEADAQKVSTEFDEEFDHVDLLALSSKIVASYFSAAEIDGDNFQALDGSPFIFSMLFCWIMAKLQANKVGDSSQERVFREKLFSLGYGKYFCTSAVTYVYMICTQPPVQKMFASLGVDLQINFSLDHSWLATSPVVDTKVEDKAQAVDKKEETAQPEKKEGEETTQPEKKEAKVGEVPAPVASAVLKTEEASSSSDEEDSPKNKPVGPEAFEVEPSGLALVDASDLISDANFLNNEAIISSPWEASFIVMQFSNIMKIMLECMSVETVPNQDNIDLLCLLIEVALSHAVLKNHLCGEFWRVVLLSFDMVPQLKPLLSHLIKDHTGVDADQPKFAKQLLEYALALNPANSRIQKEIEDINADEEESSSPQRFEDIKTETPSKHELQVPERVILQQEL